MEVKPNYDNCVKMLRDDPPNEEEEKPTSKSRVKESSFTLNEGVSYVNPKGEVKLGPV